jgi:hypothetical protein
VAIWTALSQLFDADEFEQIRLSFLSLKEPRLEQLFILFGEDLTLKLEVVDGIEFKRVIQLIFFAHIFHHFHESSLTGLKPAQFSLFPVRVATSKVLVFRLLHSLFESFSEISAIFTNIALRIVALFGRPSEA